MRRLLRVIDSPPSPHHQSLGRKPVGFPSENAEALCFERSADGALDGFHCSFSHLFTFFQNLTANRLGLMDQSVAAWTEDAAFLPGARNQQPAEQTQREKRRADRQRVFIHRVVEPVFGSSRAVLNLLTELGGAVFDVFADVAEFLRRLGAVSAM